MRLKTQKIAEVKIMLKTIQVINTFLEIISGAFQLSPSAIVTEAGVSRTLTSADNGKVIYCTSGSAVTITCAAGLGVGFSCTIIQGGAGKVTVAAGAATLNSYAGLVSIAGQYAAATLIAPVANNFILAGTLGP